MVVLIALVGFVVLMILLAVLFALPTMLLWNWLMPMLFHVPAITLVQAWGVNALCAILFKSSSVSESND